MANMIKFIPSLSASTVSLFLTFVTGIFIARILGPELRGQFALLLTAQQILNVFLAFGIHDAAFLYILKNQKNRKNIIGFYISVSIFIGIITLIGLYFYVEKFIKFEVNIYTFFIIWIAIPLNVLLGFLLNHSLVGDSDKVFNMGRVIRSLIYSCLIFSCLLLNVELSYKLIFLFILLSIMLTIYYLYFLNSSIFHEDSLSVHTVDIKKHIKGIRYFYSWNVLANLGWSVIASAPIIYLSQVETFSLVGMFGTAYNLGQAFVSLLTPSLLVMIASQDHKFVTGNILIALLILCGAGSIVTFYIADDIALMMYGAEYILTGRIIFLLTPYFGALMVAHYLNAKLKAMNRLKEIALAMIFSIVSSFMLSTMVHYLAWSNLYVVCMGLFSFATLNIFSCLLFQRSAKKYE